MGKIFKFLDWSIIIPYQGIPSKKCPPTKSGILATTASGGGGLRLQPLAMGWASFAPKRISTNMQEWCDSMYESMITELEFWILLSRKMCQLSRSLEGPNPSFSRYRKFSIWIWFICYAKQCQNNYNCGQCCKGCRSFWGPICLKGGQEWLERGQLQRRSTS